MKSCNTRLQNADKVQNSLCNYIITLEDYIFTGARYMYSPYMEIGDARYINFYRAEASNPDQYFSRGHTEKS